MQRSGFTFMMIVLGGIAVFYVWMQTDLLRLGLDIERMQGEKTLLERRQESLQYELSQLTAPQEIAQKASLELQLEIPKPGQIVMITPETAMASRRGQLQETAQLIHGQVDEVKP